MLKDLWLVLTGKLSSYQIHTLNRALDCSEEALGITKKMLQDECASFDERVISALTNELSPDRRRLSDRIAQREIERIVAEAKARAHTTGE